MTAPDYRAEAAERHTLWRTITATANTTATA